MCFPSRNYTLGFNDSQSGMPRFLRSVERFECNTGGCLLEAWITSASRRGLKAASGPTSKRGSEPPTSTPTPSAGSRGSAQGGHRKLPAQEPQDTGHGQERGLKTSLGPNPNSGRSSPSPRPRSLVSPPGTDPGRTHLPERGRRASLTSAASKANRRHQGRSLLKK